MIQNRAANCEFEAEYNVVVELPFQSQASKRVAFLAAAIVRGRCILVKSHVFTPVVAVSW